MTQTADTATLTRSRRSVLATVAGAAATLAAASLGRPPLVVTAADGRPEPGVHELLARAFDVPLELSPLVEPSVSLVAHMEDGRLEGIVLRDRTSTYRDGTRAGWSKAKDRSWYGREAWRFDRR